MKKKVIYLFLTMLLFTACNNGSKHGETTPNEENSDLSNTHIYLQNSPYKKILKKCVSAVNSNDSCTLSSLPLLHQKSLHPSKEEIMQRVIVSHDWMGRRFSEMLDILDDDIKELLGGVTAIVIDNDIKPAYYWSLTGAIYLDPRYLWLTPDEAKTVTVKDDYRESFGNKLNFITATRYVKNSKYAYRYYPLDSNLTRTRDNIKYPLARLLYHELAHANDFAPLNSISKLDKSKSIVDAIYAIRDEYTSTKLYNHSPLDSSKLKNLAKVLYRGVAATESQIALDPKDVGQLFQDDSASAIYAYSTQYEDLAMMFEQTMMRYHYGIEYDIGFVSKPKGDNITYRDYVVGWGIRNRIADIKVSDRALFVAKSILPDVTDWDDFFANHIGSSKMLKSGVNWYDNLNLKTNQKNNSIKINFSDFKYLQE